MKFCTDCDNMLYVTVEDQELRFVCKNCNFMIKHPKNDTKESIPVFEHKYSKDKNDNKPEPDDGAIDECIMNINYADDTRSYKQFITADIKHDPTLPHVNNIPCPREECKKGKGDTTDTIFIKYDHGNMKYMYFCCHCEHFWKL
jgi:hypothetical protein